MLNQNIEIAIVIIKDIMRETKRGFGGPKLPDQGVKFLLMMHTKRSIFW